MFKIANGRVNEAEVNKKTDVKNKSEPKPKETKGAKQSTGESKKKLEQDKNNIILKKPWNSSIKIDNMDKQEETSIKKKTAKKGNSSTKEKESKLNRVNSIKIKSDKGQNNSTNKGKTATTKENGGNSRNFEDENEDIYVSYSLKGYLKIKSNNKVEICDRYYTRCSEKCDGSKYVCIMDESDECEEETWCNCCEDCGRVDDDYYIEQNEYNCCSCLSRCKCIG
ncbi:hypothetical protein TpMuguga_04g00701 [Theileria parva strain Muguga]|uniref:Uncharacterized protein n=1 Tax=Theileria parva TaxID=5875 RepID=Q4N1N1_THEPA|nr:uncharacterized protein TpMuguga_04g00701 [Theileria parva strain Muguga]EAN32054.1 hypothetical protein TpMuguga_04g00701 [Theileria parva strain Muguga]|eukprot:XP_764337.1 hypothetical protein [Theileria parva strain Muguga]